MAGNGDLITRILASTYHAAVTRSHKTHITGNHQHPRVLPTTQEGEMTWRHWLLEQIKKEGWNLVVKHIGPILAYGMYESPRLLAWLYSLHTGATPEPIAAAVPIAAPPHAAPAA